MITTPNSLVPSDKLLTCQLPDVRRKNTTAGVTVNDVHSQLNSTRVRKIESPASLESLQTLIRQAGEEDMAICLAGARHSMGAQQFGTDACLIDMRALNRVLKLDAEKGTVEVEAGMQWPELIAWLKCRQGDDPGIWTIRQKQTGADHLSIGGALAANIHGRGLRMRPFVDDIDSFTLVDANGTLQRCSRSENPHLFRLAIGGYGLFGAVYSVRLRLTRRCKLRRVVELKSVDQIAEAFEERIAAGFLFGDLQFAIDSRSDDFLRRGVFSCYEPVCDESPIASTQKRLSKQDWQRLIYLAHADPSRGFEEYSQYYLATNGQTYWSDAHQLTEYVDDYHRDLDRALGARCRGSEIITEVYVPKDRLVNFMASASADFRKHAVQIIYGTIRRIEPDCETFLPWAKHPYLCVVFNVHTDHTPEGRSHSASALRRLIGRAIEHNGNFYLTYHKFATREQIETCYPQFREFLRLKRCYDPLERFQSDWYRHHKRLFAGVSTKIYAPQPGFSMNA